MNPADEGAARAIVERAARGRGGPRVSWHVALSEQAAEGWTAPLDLVFIDGDHSEEACLLDWELWHPFVEPGGAIAFHDARAAGKPGGWGDPADGRGGPAVPRRGRPGLGDRGRAGHRRSRTTPVIPWPDGRDKR